MNTFFVGKIDEVRDFQRKNKETGAVAVSTQVTATFETIDKDGYLKKDVQNLLFDISELGKLQNSKGKFLICSFVTINSPKGTYTFLDENLPYQIFEKNPLQNDIKKVS